MAFKVTFSGIDGSGKSSAVDAVARWATHRGLRVVHPYRPAFADLPGESREYYFVGVNRCMDRLHVAADRCGSRPLIGVVNIAYGRVGTWIEAYANKTYRPDLILVGRDPLLDPCAYCQYYFPWTRRLSSRVRQDVAEGVIRASRPDLIVYLDIEPIIAWTRIQDRMERERIHGSETRAKWAHIHENPGDLTFLRERFEEGIAFLRNHSDLDIVRIDASPPETTVWSRICGLIEGRIPKSRPVLSASSTFA